MVGSNTSSALLTKLLLIPVFACVVVVLGRVGVDIKLGTLAIVMVFFIVLAASFVRGTEGLYIIVFAMLFSPEISSGITTGRTGGEGGGGVVIRLEDIVIIAVLAGWMLRSAYTGRRHGIVRTPVNTAIWIYMAASVTATLLGLLRGSVESFPAGLFNNLKYFEYFLLFFLILAHVRSRQIVARMIGAMLSVFFLAMVYAYAHMGTQTRLSAPFDEGEPNTFGGYIVLLMCIAAGIALTDKRARIRIAMVLLLVFAAPPLLLTLSRSSYMAFAAAILAFLVLSHHRVLIGAVVVGLLATMLLGIPMLPERVQGRIATTFQGHRDSDERIGPVRLDSSSSQRIRAYKRAVKEWTKSPIFGHGVTGTHFIDGQFPRLLVETGVVGLSAFLVVLWFLLRHTRKIFRETDDLFLKGSAMGLFCGVVAMIAHAMSANTFIIIRIAEPLWLLAGLVFLIPMVTNAEGATEPTTEAA